ncbi:PLP-dependent aminotransferase family protein [Marinomonas sp. C2222]|uniref:PLP-dependent aminotransferase family protein n=1 Tax=Marinomonas sargassi TaxID=2984494 RepID=A0ABT2YQ02_9GAMM|nr:PLP-dependent aminotransferase family protein [Marinomonas sargassi]MCV2401958.1 PLP-dependent aminotransferase family protein [Marinomonas sargassi]
MAQPKYQEIAKAILHLIDIGHYQVDSKLPTHRTLAEDYNTTAITIAKAYKLLAEQGHIESFVGRGSFVKKATSLKAVIQSQFDDSEWNFSILQPCYANHLTELYQQIESCSNQPSSPSLFGYTEDTGSIKHKESGMLWMQKFGLQVRSPEHILLTNGAQHALSTLIENYSKPGDRIAVEALTYPGILSIIKTLGRHAVGVDMDEQGMKPEHLKAVCIEEKPSLVIALPSHQNPTTVTMPLARRKAIAEVIQQHPVWLIEDDIYNFLNDEPIAPITNLIPEKSFYISSLSKAISPGLRCGYMKVPQTQISALASYIRTMLWLASPLPFEIADRMIRSGLAFELANQQKQIAKQRQTLANEILPGVISQSTSSYHIWLTLPQKWQTDEFTTTAKERGMLVSDGQFFTANKTSTQAIRLSLMAIADDTYFEEGLRALRDLINSR